MSKQCSVIRELLSPYIDGRVTPEERRGVDEHVRRCDACATDLATLRETVTLLGRMPRVAAPRSFALDEPVRRVFPLFDLLRAGSALAAAVFVILLTVDVMRAGFIPLGGGAFSAPPSDRIMLERGEAPQAVSQAERPSMSAPRSAAPAAAKPGVAAAPQAPQGAAPPAPEAALGQQDAATARQLKSDDKTAAEPAVGPSIAAPAEPVAPAAPVETTGPIPAVSILRLAEAAALIVAAAAAAAAFWLRRT